MQEMNEEQYQAWKAKRDKNNEMLTTDGVEEKWKDAPDALRYALCYNPKYHRQAFGVG